MKRLAVLISETDRDAVIITEAELEALVDKRVDAKLAALNAVRGRLLSLTDVSKMLGFTRKTVSRLMREEGLPHAMFGRNPKFNEADVLAWHKSRQCGRTT